MDTPRIDTVQVLEERRLLVKFVNGVAKVYDCKPLVRLDAFRMLANAAFFKAVKIDAGGYGISWNDDVDLSEYELWVNGQELAATHGV
jgi:hypothetical protein